MLRFSILLVLMTGPAIFAQTSDPTPSPDSTPPPAVTSDSAATGSSIDQPPPTSTSTSTEDSRDQVWYPGDTERPKPLFTKLARNVLIDQKEIWTSPFHMHKSNAPWWIGFGAVTAALVATDHSTSKVFENSKGQVLWGNRLSNIGSTYTVLPVIFGFYGFGIWKDDPKARETGVLGTEALLDSLIVVGVLKEVALRNRPDAAKEPGQFFDGGSSFPSGHAIQVWSIASVISYEYGHTKWVPILADSLAAVVTASRFAAQKHYASDLLAGGAMGWFIGRYVWKTHQDHAIHPHSKLHAQIVPQIVPSSRTYGIGLNFGQN